MRTMTRKKKRQKRKALTNQIPKAPKKAKTTMTMMTKIFLHFSKGRRFPFTSSQCQRAKRMVVAGGCQRWPLIKTTKPMTTSSPRL